MKLMNYFRFRMDPSLIVHPITKKKLSKKHVSRDFFSRLLEIMSFVLDT